MDDDLDLMIERVRARRSENEPLYITCVKTFAEFLDELTPVTMAALEETGRVAIEREGQPVDPLTGQPIPAEIAGFMALVAKRFMSGR